MFLGWSSSLQRSERYHRHMLLLPLHEGMAPAVHLEMFHSTAQTPVTCVKAEQVPLDSLEAVGVVAGVIQTASGRWLGCQAPGGGRADVFIDLREVRSRRKPCNALVQATLYVLLALDEIASTTLSSCSAQHTHTSTTNAIAVHAFACRRLSERWTSRRPRWTKARGT